MDFYLIRGNNAERREGPQTFVRDNALNVCMSLVSCLLVVSWLTWKKPRTRKVNGLELTIKFCAVKTKLAASTSRKFKICKISSRFLNFNIFFRAFAARLGHSACSLISPTYSRFLCSVGLSALL